MRACFALCCGPPTGEQERWRWATDNGGDFFLDVSGERGRKREGAYGTRCASRGGACEHARVHTARPCHASSFKSAHCVLCSVRRRSSPRSHSHSLSKIRVVRDRCCAHSKRQLAIRLTIAIAASASLRCRKRAMSARCTRGETTRGACPLKHAFIT